MDYYYLSENGASVGPMPEAAIRGLRQAGVINDGTMIVAAGSEHWAPYGAIFAGIPRGATARKSSRGIFVVVGVLVGGLMLLVVLAAIGGIVYMGTRPKESKETRLATEEAGMSSKPAMPPASHEAKRPPAKPEPAPKEATPAPTPAIAATAPAAASPATKNAPPAPPKPEVKEPVNPLAEWYDFGFRQGTTSQKILGAFGQQPLIPRSQLFQLIKNLGGEPASVGNAEMELCLQGYKDAVAGKSMAMTVSKEQLSSVLPEPLRGYHRFKENFLAEDSDDFASRARAATVMIFAVSDSGYSQGSGFLVAPGIIVTNRHVVDGGDKLIVMMPDKTKVRAELIRKSTAIDAAVLRIGVENHPVLAFANSDGVKIGSMACAIGFPESGVLAEVSGNLDTVEAMMKLTPTSTYGRIGGRKEFESTKCLQLDLNINHGNSGGPVVDKESRVIGVSTYGLGDRKIQGLNFAIEANLVKRFVTETVPGISLE